MVTTESVTIRINKKVLSAYKAKAKAAEEGYQSLINQDLARSVDVTLPPITRTLNAKPKKDRAAQKTKKRKVYASKKKGLKMSKGMKGAKKASKKTTKKAK